MGDNTQAEIITNLIEGKVMKEENTPKTTSESAVVVNCQVINFLAEGENNDSK